jgi:ankyrin repeat protein
VGIQRLAQAADDLAQSAHWQRPVVVDGGRMTIKPAAVAAMFEAIRTGNDLAVDTAVALNEDLLRAHDEAGLSPVVAAATAGHIRLAERLAARLIKSEGGIGFFDAAAVGNLQAVRRLLSEDLASVDDRGPDGRTALHLASRFGQMEVARLLLGRGADPNAIALDDERVTPLYAAVSAKHRDTASLLLALGASPNSVQRGGWTALHAAARNGDQAIVDMLLLRGADATREADNGHTAIDLAELNGHAALTRSLRLAAAKR